MLLQHHRQTPSVFRRYRQWTPSVLHQYHQWTRSVVHQHWWQPHPRMLPQWQGLWQVAALLTKASLAHVALLQAAEMSLIRKHSKGRPWWLLQTARSLLAFMVRIQDMASAEDPLTMREYLMQVLTHR